MKLTKVLTLALTVSTVASAQTSAPLPQKDPGVATLIGVIVPGGGQLYAEETGRGFAFMIGTAAAIGLGFALDKKEVPDIVVPPIMSGGFNIPGYTFEGSAPDHTGPIVGSIVGAAIWIWGAVDAGPAALRTNSKRSRVSIVPSHGGAAINVTF